MTDLESPRKNNDCYFYYYSKCSKGDSCTFRHEPSALGCETMCSFWKEGKCVNIHCNFRHMELRKNRKAIACYWESQPGGCLKPHCPFMHQNSRPLSSDESTEHRNDDSTEEATKNLGEKTFRNTPVDSLVVNFEEESDNESMPTESPVKPIARNVKEKTLEQLKLEEIQAESAAYYSYSDDSNDLRQKILERITRKSDPIPRRKRLLETLAEDTSATKRVKLNEAKDFKIKTLTEIRAERAQRSNTAKENASETLVSSTTDEAKPTQPPKKFKLQRRLPNVAKETTGDVIETSETSTQVAVQETNTVPAEENKIDEILLLQDDDDASNVSLKDEERLLNELDDDL